MTNFVLRMRGSVMLHRLLQQPERAAQLTGAHLLLIVLQCLT